MEKKIWSRPTVDAVTFAANDYVYVCTLAPVYDHIGGRSAQYMLIDDGDGDVDANWGSWWSASNAVAATGRYQTENVPGTQGYLDGVYEWTTGENNTVGKDMLLASSMTYNDSSKNWSFQSVFKTCDSDVEVPDPDSAYKGWASQDSKNWVPALIWWAGDGIHAAFSFERASRS